VISVGLAVVFQVLWLILVIVVLGKRYPFITTLIDLISVVAILWLVSKDINPAYKLAWTILILAVPVAGAVIYLLFGKSWIGKDMQLKLERSYQDAAGFMSEDQDARDALRAKSRAADRQSCYIRDIAGFPLYQKTSTRYFRVGEELYASLMEELKKAEHYIFMEYFIIDDGEMWQAILNILEEKAQMGLDVRLIYDDFGCASTMPKEFQLSLQRRQIRCEVFNPLVPIPSVMLNNRDHRKITVIDGYVAFTGGSNLADEYINRKERFGYWKDTGVMLKGEAVRSFTVMFLQMWSVLAQEKIDYSRYQPHVWHEGPFEDDGFVQPYGDTPLDHETVGEYVYLNIINRAKDYVYIFTPYLITDNEVITALCLAAKSGVDVRIVTPGIPDKKLVFLLTQSYYDPLIAAGVKIFEYKPGFLHAKSFVSDDRIAAVGTINLDYRSLYLHFECGVWMYESEAVLQIKEDAMKIFQECREITIEDCRNKSAWTRIWQSVLRLFAPLL
jgi:cardiolipin synthase